MKYTEEEVLFACQDDTLLGILAKPETPAVIGVVIVVGGPQYRGGSHRQFVLLSRAMASAGYTVLRFDYRGMGDSEGEQRNFEQVGADVAAAIDVLVSNVPSVKQVVLWGLCDGASAALLYLGETQDPRVTGLCLINPWIRSAASQAKTLVKHYYTKRMTQKDFWTKLIYGKVTVEALRDFAQKILLSAYSPKNPESANKPFHLRMAEAWHSFSGDILLFSSGEDYTAKEFVQHASSDAAWAGSLTRSQFVHRLLPGVDHTFSSAASRTVLGEQTLIWLSEHARMHSLVGPRA